MTEKPKFAFASLDAKPQAPTVIYFVPEEEGLPAPIGKLDAATLGAVSKAMEATSFKRKRKSAVEILAPHGVQAARILLVGVGDPKTLNRLEWLEIGGAVRGKLPSKALEIDAVFDGLDPLGEEAPLAFAEGFALRAYAFKKYKGKSAQKGDGEDQDADNDRTPARLTIFSKWGDRLAAGFEKEQSIVSGVYFARDLVNEPANVLTPPEFVERLRALETEGLKVEVVGERALRSLGMNALLSVGQGSAQPSAAVVLRWRGAPSHDASEGNLVFIGKGVCFDSGGISIKPGQGMEDMKGDMAGAAAVAGALVTLARRKAPVNAIGLVGLVENMPSGTATRPGDIVTSASGQTIEILNTDAEGRLVLADLIWYAQTHLEPKLIMTLATLTGAIMIALGKEHAGLFSNDDDLAAKILEAGLDTGEKAWRLPLSKKYNKMIDSKLADIKNIGGRDAGSITAAQFLLRFVKNGTPWAHLDIAGTAMGSPASDINQSWASGFGVRLLDHFAAKFYEHRSEPK
jgi:leucyl aminopeptidase